MAETTAARPLISYCEGSSVRVTQYHGCKCFRGRLLAMGIIPGTIVTVLSNNGRMKIRVRETELAIGHEMAAKIMALPACNCRCK